MWYREVIGGDRPPIVDTWWQTETGAIMISPLPGVTAGKPGSAMKAAARHRGRRRRRERRLGAQRLRRLPRGQGARGPRCCAPSGATTSATRTPTGRASAKPGLLLRRRRRQEGRRRRHLAAGPRRRRHERLGPPALDHRDRVGPGLAPQGRRGRRRGRQGRGHRPGRRAPSSSCATPPATAATTSSRSCATHVRKEIGPIANPRQIMVVPELPKTRSGKIMRRLLRDVAENREVGDVTTLADSSVMDLISSRHRSARQGRATCTVRARAPAPRQRTGSGVAQQQVGHGEHAGDGGDDGAVAGEVPERDRACRSGAPCPGRRRWRWRRPRWRCRRGRRPARAPTTARRRNHPACRWPGPRPPAPWSRRRGCCRRCPRAAARPAAARAGPR